MKEYRKIADLTSALKKELNDNASFFDNFEGKSLDEQQRIACVLNDCDLEIIAGAGTGKTQTLVAKSSYLIEKKGIKPSEILCLSFSNSSVDDLSKRLIHQIETRTIHSLGLSIIRQYDDKDVLDDNEFYDIFNQYLEDASPKQLFDIRDHCETYLAKSNVKIKLNEIESEEEKLDYLIKNTYIRRDLKQFIGLYKGKDYDISDLPKFKKACEDDLKGSKYYYQNMSFLNIADSVFRYYQSFLSRNQMIDFNDMINKAIKFIDKYGFGDYYKYIFVDEYQDMSYKNFQLLKAIKDKTNANLVVVGDDWQSIYGFRDSDLGLFTNFSKYFPDANRVFIEKTYRNPQQLIDVAGKFIMKNEDQFKKSLKSDLSCDKPIKIVYHSLKSESENHTAYNLIYNLSENDDVMILGRHRADIDEFLKETDLVKKGRSKNFKQITDEYGNISNVEFRTIHKAKGLEADYAIIVQVIDDWLGFPNKLSPSYFMSFIQDWNIVDKFDEERRLFYVAMTRAKKGVYIFTTRRESEYVTELKNDSSNNLEIIYSNDETTYSHLEEFRKAPKPQKPAKKSRHVKELDVEIPLTGENAEQIEIKAHLKETGNKIKKSKDYDEAEDFYTKLLTNMFFVNDYYPYRKLVEVYVKKKESANVIRTIEEFFKSGIYCNNSQVLWFKYQFRKACTYTGTNFSKFDEYLKYFNQNSVKNIDKQNDPLPIAARIQTKNGHVSVISQENHDLNSQKKELEQKYKFEKKYGTSEDALFYFEQLWNQKEFNKNLTAYKRLCTLYEDVGQYEKVISVANEYFTSSARRTKSSPDWFKRKIRKAEKKLGKKQSDFKDLSETPKNTSNNNFITVSNKNHRKLLSCNVGDVITIKKSHNRTKFEVIEIMNPNAYNVETEDNLTIGTSLENYELINSLEIGDLLVVGHKNYPGEVTLKVLHNY